MTTRETVQKKKKMMMRAAEVVLALGLVAAVALSEEMPESAALRLVIKPQDIILPSAAKTSPEPPPSTTFMQSASPNEIFKKLKHAEKTTMIKVSVCQVSFPEKYFYRDIAQTLDEADSGDLGQIQSYKSVPFQEEEE